MEEDTKSEEGRPVLTPRATVILAVFLLVPALIRSLSTEPFPAVLLPAGSGQLSVEDGIVTFSHSSLWAHDIAGNAHKLDAESFLDPVPVHFLGPLTSFEFGLTPERRTVLYLRRPVPMEFELDVRPSNPEHLAEARSFFARRLRSLNLSDASLTWRTVSSRVRHDTGEELESTVESERTIQLR